MHTAFVLLLSDTCMHALLEAKNLIVSAKGRDETAHNTIGLFWTCLFASAAVSSVEIALHRVILAMEEEET